jgi:hypothetical protein
LEYQRLNIDAVADDVKSVRTAFLAGNWLLWLAWIFAFCELLAPVETDMTYRAATRAFALLGMIACPALLLSFNRLRRGRPTILANLTKAGVVVVLLVAIGHLVWVRSDPRRWNDVDFGDIFAAAFMYFLGISCLGLLLVSCNKARRLSSFDGAGALPSHINVLEAVSGRAKWHVARLLATPLRRFPVAAFWGVLSLAARFVGAIVAVILLLITRGIQYLIPFRSLLDTLGPKITRPIFEFSRSAAETMRRHASPDAREMLRHDSRPPVLVLRSFLDDQRPSFRDDVEAWSGQGELTFEEALTVRLERIGPVVALGRPGEELPSAGAAREYVPDTNWKSRIEYLLRQASVIVIIAGRTNSLTWEVQLVETLGMLERTLVIVPGQDRAEVRSRLATLMSSVGMSTLGMVIRDLLHEDAAVIHICNTAVLEIGSERRAQRDYQAALDVGLALLRHQAQRNPSQCTRAAVRR